MKPVLRRPRKEVRTTIATLFVLTASNVLERRVYRR